MFEIAVVNEPSVFEPLKFYCSSCCILDNNDSIKDEVNTVSI